jgi:guanylate kinase
MLDAHSLPGTLFVVAAPSGAGKTSLVRKLLKLMPDMSLSISCTTRARREREIDGEDYYFVDDAKFEAMVEADDFLEYADVYNARYGTPRPFLLEKLEQGEDIILEIDWQGARQIRQSFPAAVLIFVLPPSKYELEQRLRLRAQDDEPTVTLRMADAVNEMGHYKEFDYLIINDDFDVALAEMQSIITSRRLLLPQQSRRRKILLSQLLAESE